MNGYAWLVLAWREFSGNRQNCGDCRRCTWATLKVRIKLKLHGRRLRK